MGRCIKYRSTFPGIAPTPRDLHWLRAVHHKVLTYISPDDQTLMKNAVDDFESEFSQHGELPQGAVHGDLFRDNTLFEGDALGGIIDFYNGCTGDLLFDLAIVINDWASNEDGSLNAERYNAILSAYQARRPLTESERTLWPTMLRMTALRYWLSRLLVVYVDPPAHDLTPTTHERFRMILKARIAFGALDSRGIFMSEMATTSSPAVRARRTWNMDQWGSGYFDVDDHGQALVRPLGSDAEGPALPISALVRQLQAAGLRLPVLVRFSDILHDRVEQLCGAFDAAMQDVDYQGGYTAVYPIKVNQQRRVVEEILATSERGNGRVGLEAGSKPELLAVLALSDGGSSLIVCNGYKDREYVRLALLGARPQSVSGGGEALRAGADFRRGPRAGRNPAHWPARAAGLGG